MAANDRQEGGDHYKKFGDLQPWDVIIHFRLGFLVGNAVKYLLRCEHKGMMKLDLQKAKHYIDKMLETLEKEDAKKAS